MKAVPVASTAQFIPMRLLLKQFYELPGIFHAMMSFLKILEKEMKDGLIRNIIQAEFWQKLG